MDPTESNKRKGVRKKRTARAKEPLQGEFFTPEREEGASEGREPQQIVWRIIDLNSFPIQRQLPAPSPGLDLSQTVKHDDIEVRVPSVSMPDLGVVEYVPPPTDGYKFETSLLALSRIKGLGRKGLAALVDRFQGRLENVWAADEETLRSALQAARTPNPIAVYSAIRSSREELLYQGWSELEGISLKEISILPPDELPTELQRISTPPRWLFVEGDATVLRWRPTVAVVGTRNPSSLGLRAARIVAKLLSAYPITLVSGLAEGIDAAAHIASLDEGVRNLAFLGHGVSEHFPSSTSELRNRIISSGGAVASEYLPYEHPQKPYFVERNRLQAAIADVVIPVEAKSKSGTAHTVRFAAEYGKTLVGLRWPGANGILGDLEEGGHEVVDILDRGGCRRLDAIFRGLVDRAGLDSYPLASLERRAVAEIETRTVRPEDVERLVRGLKAAAARNDVR